ncbi:hypothetical protein D0O09_32300 [Pseudomonas putida]|nr:hypothetical protein D0O09_32300 [Pseudomonas putida]
MVSSDRGLCGGLKHQTCSRPWSKDMKRKNRETGRGKSTCA